MATWRDFEKRAQVFGSFSPAHDADSAREFSNASYGDIWNGAKDLANGAWRGLSSAGGALIGAIQQYVEAVGRGALPAPDMDKSWMDLSVRDTGNAAAAAEQVAGGARTGAQVGWRDADRVANDAKVTAGRIANNFGLYGDEKVIALQKENDKKILEQINRANAGSGYKFKVPEEPPKDKKNGLLVPVTDASGREDPQYEEYNNYIKWARGGQSVADFTGTMAAGAYLGRGTGWATDKLTKGLNAFPKTKKVINLAGKWAPEVPMAKMTAEGAVNNLRKQRDEDIAGAKRSYESAVMQYLEMDPASDNARRMYEVLKSQSGNNPELFASLEPPQPFDKTAPTVPQTSGQQSSGGWSMSPELQNLLGYGLGGALLGGLFGGKGGWWKWALLASILGAIQNGGGIGNAWNGISSILSGQKK